MTVEREEALKMLKYNSNVIHQTIDGRTDPKEVEALDMAIEALEQQPCDDCISRQAVLDAINTYDKFGYTETGCFVREPKGDYVPYIHYDDVIKCVKNEPSVTPKQEPCEDCISRQAVDKLSKELVHTTKDKADFLCNFWEGLQKLPSVTPKEKTGKWIDEADDIDAQFGRHEYKCSKCGKYAEYFVSGTEVWWDRIKPNFCPNCGVRMVSK